MLRFPIVLLVLIFAFPSHSELTHLHPGKVRLQGEIGERIDRTIENNLMVLDLEKDFLKPFRDRNAQGGFIGLGMLIDSAVKLAFYSQDKKVIDRKDFLIDEALKTQQPDGYLGMMAPEARIWSLWDIHEMSYLIAGLVSDYRLFGSQRSLDAAKKIADSIIIGWNTDPNRQPGGGEITVYMAVTGSETAMLDLYELTGEERYLEYCTELRGLDEWDGPIVIGRWGPIQGHAYAYMSRCLAQIHLNRILPDPRLLNPTRKVLQFLMEGDGLVISGACGDHECWHNTQEGTTNLGETCATAYLIRFLDTLYRQEANPIYGDLMERAIYNALFAAQSPDGRRIRYYTPYEVPRVYFDGDTYCCPCNYRRILGELPNLVFYRSEKGVLVNLYTQGTASFDLANGTTVSVTQSTDYPVSATSELRISVDQPTPFEISFRIPRGCQGANLWVNEEEKIEAPLEAGTIQGVERTWKNGDRIHLSIPMKPRWVRGRQTQAGRVALMVGPRVFGVNRAKINLDPNLDLRLVTIDPDSLEGPFPDDTYRKGGVAYSVEAWKPGEFYPMAPKGVSLRLTEFPDPGIEQVYFKVPNPTAESLVSDVWVGPK